MNGSIAKYFKSPKVEQPVDERPPPSEQQQQQSEPLHEEGAAVPEAGPSKPSPPPVAYSKSEEDRRIAENMASVLKSLKKKRSHKCSKRRRNGEHHKDHKEKHPEPETVVPEEEEVAEKVDARRRSPRKASQESKTPSKSMKEKPMPPKNQPPGDPAKEGKENKKLNAFQLMMSSRNKAIGSNSPGKEGPTAKPTLTPEESQQREDKVKRKLKLEEWADRKGAGKRKLQEEAEEEFIAHQMDRRAKRLKRLINNMEAEEESLEAAVTAAESPPRKSSRLSKVESPSTVQLKVTGKKGRKRLSSDDSNSQPSKTADKAPPEKSPVKQEPQSDEFINKLSSPLKKKDSLLGYFSKVGKDSSSPETTPVVEKVPRGRGRPRRQPLVEKPPQEDLILNPIIVEELSEDQHPEEEAMMESPLNTSASGRPRRSCAGKIKDYAVFGGTSPDKESAAPRKKPIVTPLKIINVGSPQTMQVVKSPSVRQLSVDDEPGTPKSGRSVKLAPLFVKKVAEDPAKVRARQEFLMSGIPEKMRLEIEKQRCFEESILNESPVFPLVSHVQQLESLESVAVPTLEGSRVRILPDSPGKGAIVTKEDEFEFGMLTDSDDFHVENILTKLVDQGDPNSVYNYDLPTVSDVKTVVREWKQSYKHFPVFKCYKQYRAMYEEHVDEPLPARPGGVAGRLDVSEDSIELVEPKYSFKNGELLFTEKYKPINTEQILINCQPAVALKKFLSSWKEDRTNPYDSDDDFENSNSNSSSSSAICNHMVLVGPPGCGKTSNVYAVASDMNFNVLELNASSRRKGKIILQELQEATQSHQVRRKDEPVDIFKKALVRKGSKTKFRQLSTDSDGGSSGSKKLSLILIEDADIIFEQDDGFLAAINQLISTSKRPIVLTTTDPNCAHLARYIANNVIRYVAPGIGHVAKLLSILAIVERVHIDQSDLARLYAFNRKDLRKTLNELQFFIQSGGDRDQPVTAPLFVEEPEIRMETPTSALGHDDEGSRQSGTSTPTEASSRQHRSLFRLFSRNQNQSQLIRSPLNFDNLWCNMERVLRTEPATVVTQTKTKKKPKQKPVANRKTHDLNDELVFFYENVSVACLIQRDAQSCAEDRLVEHLEEEVAHELVEGSWEHWFEGGMDRNNATDKRRSGVGAMCYDSLKKFDEDDRQTIACHIGIAPVRSRSTYCDYEPFLRTICRCERERSRAERRGSRFYHYFRNYCHLGPTTTMGTTSSSSSTVSSFSVDHFDALSSRFEELQPVQQQQQQKVPAASGATVDSSDESR